MTLNPNIDLDSSEVCEHNLQRRFCYICRGVVDLELVAKVTADRNQRSQQRNQEQLLAAARREFCSECGYRLSSELIEVGVTVHATCSGEDSLIRLRNASQVGK